MVGVGRICRCISNAKRWVRNYRQRKVGAANCHKCSWQHTNLQTQLWPGLERGGRTARQAPPETVRISFAVSSFSMLLPTGFADLPAFFSSTCFRSFISLLLLGKCSLSLRFAGGNESRQTHFSMPYYRMSAQRSRYRMRAAGEDADKDQLR